jgi:hypothetical protein
LKEVAARRAVRPRASRPTDPQTNKQKEAAVAATTTDLLMDKRKEAVAAAAMRKEAKAAEARMVIRPTSLWPHDPWMDTSKEAAKAAFTMVVLAWTSIYSSSHTEGYT